MTNYDYVKNATDKELILWFYFVCRQNTSIKRITVLLAADIDLDMLQSIKKFTEVKEK